MTSQVNQKVINKEQLIEWFQLGCKKKELWSKKGWNWKCKNKIIHPLGWKISKKVNILVCLLHFSFEK